MRVSHKTKLILVITFCFGWLVVVSLIVVPLLPVIIEGIGADTGPLYNSPEQMFADLKVGDKATFNGLQNPTKKAECVNKEDGSIECLWQSKDRPNAKVLVIFYTGKGVSPKSGDYWYDIEVIGKRDDVLITEAKKAYRMLS